MDHDRLFKELLRTFFAESVELFLPDVAAYLDRGSVEFLDKEVFTDVTAGERHEVDLLAKARFRGQDGFFLVHVENQARAHDEFAKRMFRYFARLYARHDLPIYPVALLSYDTPRRAEPARHRVRFPDTAVLDFRFRVIQLNRLRWRDFLRRPNPVAAALMTKMRIAPKDRPRVRLECLRLLATLRLDPARQGLIRGFMEAYLRLNAAEERAFDRELRTIDPREQESVMTYIDHWEERGARRGFRKAVLALLRRRFGAISDELESATEQLTADQLEQMTERLLDFKDPADALAWVKANG